LGLGELNLFGGKKEEDYPVLRWLVKDYWEHWLVGKVRRGKVG